MDLKKSCYSKINNFVASSFEFVTRLFSCPFLECSFTKSENKGIWAFNKQILKLIKNFEICEKIRKLNLNYIYIGM